jgi:tRNA-2-methylthio-N6-dimethylallyladenosine synthase
MHVEHKKARVVAFGCQMNERDAETISGLLEQIGYETARPGEDGGDRGDADLVIFVTCCVRENAENRALGNLGDTKRLKERRPGMIVGISGCMVQQEHVRAMVRDRMPWVDLVFGTHNIHRLPELVARVAAGERVIEVWDEAHEIVEGLPASRAFAHKAFVNITYGCNNFCAYCIVPYVRGRERSRRPEDILAEVRELAASGCREVTLLGQNVNSYGRGLPPGSCGRAPDFADLLRAVNAVTGISRIRFTTSHPRDFSDEMIGAVASCEKVCEHFHLPLQAGSDRVLKAMNRGYTRARYLDLLSRIRQAVPGASITTDIMVGFPGETEADFEATLDVVREARFDAAFTFIYSPREGTVAASLPDQVPEDVKRGRIYRLIELVNATAESVNESLRGHVVEVMVDGPSERDPSTFAGRTRSNKMVHWRPKAPDAAGADGDRRSGGVLAPGDLVMVKVIEPHTWTLHGEQIGVPGKAGPIE